MFKNFIFIFFFLSSCFFLQAFEPERSPKSQKEDLVDLYDLLDAKIWKLREKIKKKPKKKKKIWKKLLREYRKQLQKNPIDRVTLWAFIEDDFKYGGGNYAIHRLVHQGTVKAKFYLIDLNQDPFYQGKTILMKDLLKKTSLLKTKFSSQKNQKVYRFDVKNVLKITQSIDRKKLSIDQKIELNEKVSEALALIEKNEKNEQKLKAKRIDKHSKYKPRPKPQKKIFSDLKEDLKVLFG